jgi:hypothetical protein
MDFATIDDAIVSHVEKAGSLTVRATVLRVTTVLSATHNEIKKRDHF